MRLRATHGDARCAAEGVIQRRSASGRGERGETATCTALREADAIHPIVLPRRHHRRAWRLCRQMCGHRSKNERRILIVVIGRRGTQFPPDPEPVAMLRSTVTVHVGGFVDHQVGPPSRSGTYER